ncbi:MAG: hypothetical protein ACOYY2_09230, partial [Actinomycetota bacterium]
RLSRPGRRPVHPARLRQRRPAPVPWTTSPAGRWPDLPTGCRFIVNAANTTTSARFGFEREAVGDYVAGEVPTVGTGLRLAQAVAASAAVPGCCVT